MIEERYEDMGPLAQYYMMSYGINVNLQRAIPLITDGLKPVMRRILYQIWVHYKDMAVPVASAIGDLGKIHPHGDQGQTGTFARMAQPFSNNIPLLVAKGNPGTAVAGDDYAAARYFKVKLSKFVMDVLFKDFDGKVNMKPAYDDVTLEPFSLPSRFPIILLNGSSGIGYTLSSMIYPHNLNEIADATIKLLKNPDAKVTLVPDSPTGCDIIIKDEFTSIMQSSFEIDNVNYIITIKNTPYGVYLDDIDDALRTIQDSDNPISEIISADDESKLNINKIRYVIRCKPCNLYTVINKLFKRVPGFRITVSARNMTVVDAMFNTRQYDVRQILCSWIKTRLIEKRGWLLRDLVAKTTEYNMLEGKLFMLSPKNLDKTIKIFRSCESKQDIIPSLVEGYKGMVTTSQANYVSELKMYRLTNSEYNKTRKEIIELEEKINETREIVENPIRIRDVIIDEIKEIKEKYGFHRRSKILNNSNGDSVNIGVVQILADGTILFSETENPEHLSSDVTPISGDNVCLIDENGSFLWVNTNEVMHDKPMTLTSIGRSVMGKCVAAISNPENNVVLLSNKGRIKYIPIANIPSNATRKPLIPLDDDETLVSVLEVCNNGNDVLVYTSDGLGKRVQMSDLNLVKSVDAQGQFIAKDVDSVSGMFIINSNKPWMVYVTRLGRIRVNHAKFLNTVKKFSNMKPIIKLSQQDDLIAVFCADKNQKITLSHVDSRVSTVNIDSIEPSTMAIPPIRPKHVPGVRVIRATLS